MRNKNTNKSVRKTPQRLVGDRQKMLVIEGNNNEAKLNQQNLKTHFFIGTKFLGAIKLINGLENKDI